MLLLCSLVFPKFATYLPIFQTAEQSSIFSPNGLGRMIKLMAQHERLTMEVLWKLIQDFESGLSNDGSFTLSTTNHFFHFWLNNPSWAMTYQEAARCKPLCKIFTAVQHLDENQAPKLDKEISYTMSDKSQFTYDFMSKGINVSVLE